MHNAQVYTVHVGTADGAGRGRPRRSHRAGGQNQAALELRGPETRVIDARGTERCVPGLQDSHGHFTGLGASLQVLRLRGTTSYEQIVEMVRARAATARPANGSRTKLGSERLGGEGVASTSSADATRPPTTRCT